MATEDDKQGPEKTQRLRASKIGIPSVSTSMSLKVYTPTDSTLSPVQPEASSQNSSTPIPYAASSNQPASLPHVATTDATPSPVPDKNHKKTAPLVDNLALRVDSSLSLNNPMHLTRGTAEDTIKAAFAGRYWYQRCDNIVFPDTPWNFTYFSLNPRRSGPLFSHGDHVAMAHSKVLAGSFNPEAELPTKARAFFEQKIYEALRPELGVAQDIPFGRGCLGYLVHCATSATLRRDLEHILGDGGKDAQVRFKLVPSRVVELSLQHFEVEDEQRVEALRSSHFELIYGFREALHKFDPNSPIERAAVLALYDTYRTKLREADKTYPDAPFNLLTFYRQWGTHIYDWRKGTLEALKTPEPSTAKPEVAAKGSSVVYVPTHISHSHVGTAIGIGVAIAFSGLSFAYNWATQPMSSDEAYRRLNEIEARVGRATPQHDAALLERLRAMPAEVRAAFEKDGYKFLTHQEYAALLAEKDVRIDGLETISTEHALRLSSLEREHATQTAVIAGQADYDERIGALEGFKSTVTADIEKLKTDYAQRIGNLEASAVTLSGKIEQLDAAHAQHAATSSKSDNDTVAHLADLFGKYEQLRIELEKQATTFSKNEGDTAGHLANLFGTYAELRIAQERQATEFKTAEERVITLRESFGAFNRAYERFVDHTGYLPDDVEAMKHDVDERFAASEISRNEYNLVLERVAEEQSIADARQLHEGHPDYKPSTPTPTSAPRRSRHELDMELSASIAERTLAKYPGQDEASLAKRQGALVTLLTAYFESREHDMSSPEARAAVEQAYSSKIPHILFVEAPDVAWLHGEAHAVVDTNFKLYKLEHQVTPDRK